jgi:hypothetical protein
MHSEVASPTARHPAEKHRHGALALQSLRTSLLPVSQKPPCLIRSFLHLFAAAMSPSAVWRLCGRTPGVGSGAAPGVPVAEVEAVGTGLSDEQMEQFKTGHKWADSSAEATFRRGCMGRKTRLKAI